MRRQAYSYGTGIFLDRCYSCNGIWLDKGELAAIRENFRDKKARKQIVENLVYDKPEIAEEFIARESELAELDSKYSKRRFQGGKTKGLFGFFDSIF
jgi:Zn-finger nucleic acid-binding protein